MTMQCPYKRTYMYTTAWSREEVNSTKLVHKFRAATFEWNAVQCEIELLLTLYHNKDVLIYLLWQWICQVSFYEV